MQYLKLSIAYMGILTRYKVEKKSVPLHGMFMIVIYEKTDEITFFRTTAEIDSTLEMAFSYN